MMLEFKLRAMYIVGKHLAAELGLMNLGLAVQLRLALNLIVFLLCL